MNQPTIPSDLRDERYEGMSTDWIAFMATLKALEDRGWTYKEMYAAIDADSLEPEEDPTGALFALLRQPSPEERREAAARRREYYRERVSTEPLRRRA